MTTKRGVTKIGTIGDAFVAATGCLPMVSTAHDENHANNLALLAIDMLGFMDKYEEVPLEENESALLRMFDLDGSASESPTKIPPKNSTKLQMRIGIHAGPATGGVIGHSVMQYNLFGYAVNVANLAESTGQAGKIHVTFEAVQLLREAFEFVEVPKESLTTSKGDPVDFGKPTYFLNQVRP
mmetsp:Transcript_31973/g.44317  ORF Transcript_31973/g.44317 Transcript_31973/m.44317 type:complete len:182 (-) Transcript_31973:24-569(-)